MNRMSVLVFFFLFGELLSANAAAQGSARIAGTVRDQMNAPLAGAQVTATHAETGYIRQTSTDQNGYYVIPDLPIGAYQLLVSLPGFRSIARSGLTLQINSEAVVDAVLESGPTPGQVEVQAEANLPETRGAATARQSSAGKF